MAFVILKNDNGNLEALGPYLEEVSESDLIMKHGIQIELRPYCKCDAVVDINLLKGLLDAAYELIQLVENDDSRYDAWFDEVRALMSHYQLVRSKAYPYFQQNFTED